MSSTATPNVQIGTTAQSSIAVQIPDGLYVNAGVGTTSASLKPQAVYNGGYTEAKDIKLRIANGGAGQSGLIGEWADAFIKYSVAKGLAPFCVGWYLGDTTESLGLLAADSVDIAVTYNAAAEKQSIRSGASVERLYGFRDHFLLVGPKSNPAKLIIEDEDILDMFNKIVTSGNADVTKPPTDRAPTRFLSRFDKSATNIKESQLFITIGQVPWALVYSKWYHQYPMFPLQALQAASELSEYTVTDRGTWLSSPSSVTSQLQIFKTGTDKEDDLLLNPAFVLLGSKANASAERGDLCRSFMEWVVSASGGQKIIEGFKKPDGPTGKVLYTKAPTSSVS